MTHFLPELMRPAMTHSEAFAKLSKVLDTTRWCLSVSYQLATYGNSWDITVTARTGSPTHAADDALDLSFSVSGKTVEEAVEKAGCRIFDILMATCSVTVTPVCVAESFSPLESDAALLVPAPDEAGDIFIPASLIGM